jgi:ABC-2 type transport system ATP-binding protein
VSRHDPLEPRLEASADLVRTHALCRRFGDRTAVNNLSLTLRRGEVVALLGPNGAGKTTTLRMLAGLIAPSSGSIALGGVPLTAESADALRGRVGLLTEMPGLWDRLSVRVNLLTYARLYGLAPPQQVVDRTLAMVGLSDRARDMAGTLSKGLRQRLAIGRALMHEPSIVLLDEPTAGLDPSSARHVRNLIADVREQGRAVLVSTHNLGEAEELADRIAVLKTELLALDTPAALRAERRGVRVEFEVEGEAARWRAAVAVGDHESIATEGRLIVATLASADRVPDLVAALVAAGARVHRVTPAARSLEEIYLTLVGAAEGAA